MPALCLPEYGAPEYDSTFLDKLHAHVPALLSAAAAQDMQQDAKPEADAVVVSHALAVHACEAFFIMQKETNYTHQHVT